MRSLQVLTAAAAVLSVSSASAAQISGEYLESRTCNVYIGPCFANAEMGQAGREAVLAWKVDKGAWQGVALDGLGVALVLSAEGTLGHDGVFDMKAGKIDSVILVDERASAEQQQALVSFVEDSARHLAGNVLKVEKVPFRLENDHADGRGTFEAGDVARIETRAIDGADCVCSNEDLFYLPLVEVQHFRPAYSQRLSYQGSALNNRWSMAGQTGAYLATFRR